MKLGRILCRHLFSGHSAMGLVPLPMAGCGIWVHGSRLQIHSQLAHHGLRQRDTGLWSLFRWCGHSWYHACHGLRQCNTGLSFFKPVTLMLATHGCIFCSSFPMYSMLAMLINALSGISFRQMKVKTRNKQDSSRTKAYIHAPGNYADSIDVRSCLGSNFVRICAGLARLRASTPFARLRKAFS